MDHPGTTTAHQQISDEALRHRWEARYNRGMAETEKLAISLPSDLIADLRGKKDTGEINSVSGHIAELLRREQEANDVQAVFSRLFGDDPRPGPEHLDWARQALGVESQEGA